MDQNEGERIVVELVSDSVSCGSLPWICDLSDQHRMVERLAASRWDRSDSIIDHRFR